MGRHRQIGGRQARLTCGPCSVPTAEIRAITPAEGADVHVRLWGPGTCGETENRVGVPDMSGGRVWPARGVARARASIAAIVLALIVIACGLAAPAAAEGYPLRPVKIV